MLFRSKPDLLTRRLGPGMVTDGHFVDFYAHPAGLGRDFRAETESVLLQVHPLQHLAAEELVAGGLIRERLARDKVGKPCEQAIAECVPSQTAADCFGAQKA